MLLQFLQQLRVRKTLADRLLRQLAGHWQQEFEVLCTLLANSLVVHADETRWSINSVWTLLSEKARLLLFGVHKDGDTLKHLLDPATFAGLVISDDAAVYAAFSHGQKCWAHLLRKAIKLTLQEPNEPAYRQFTDRLLAIYRAACRVQQDQRLGKAGRARKVAALDDEVLAHVAWPGAGAGRRSDQQDHGRGAATDHSAERVGIVASVPARVQPRQRDRRGRALGGSG